MADMSNAEQNLLWSWKKTKHITDTFENQLAMNTVGDQNELFIKLLE
jgi:uncharacterized protein with NRDE domain